MPVNSAGCSFDVTAVSYSNKVQAGLFVNFYRYHSADGVYYFEAFSPLVGNTYDTTEDQWKASAYCTFALSDDYLSLNNELEIDNDTPPEHTVATIWNGRAFYVDALNPSRLYFSKLYQIAAVPRSNLLWTDEGVGGNILGFLEISGALMLLRESSIWIIPQFSTDDTAYAQLFIPGIGCVSGSCAVWANGILWWASPGGIYSWDKVSCSLS